MTVFLSTLSLRRATRLGRLISRAIHHFYPRSPCGERLDTDNNFGGNDHISIHALLAESDGFCFWMLEHRIQFLSTLSLRRATVKLFRQNYECFISIHALLAESDLTIGSEAWLKVVFLSTLSLRRATCRSA